MALSEFEIAIGGLTSIPVLSGLIFLGYKSVGEISLDTSKLKPKKRPAFRLVFQRFLGGKPEAQYKKRANNFAGELGGTAQR